MLRISKLTDYAIVVLTNMVGPVTSGPHTARGLADRTRIPQPTVSKILKDLARSGLVLSTRGVQGGYSLARGPEHISVVEVIDAVDGPLSITECSSAEPTTCDYAGSCPVEANWVRINQVVRAALSTISLADMARPLTPPLISLSRAREPSAPDATRRTSHHFNSETGEEQT